MASSDDKVKASSDGTPKAVRKRNKKKKDKLPQNERIRKEHRVHTPLSTPSSAINPPLSPSSAASDDVDEADYISPQLIHEQRVKEAERERRETARTKTARIAADGSVQDVITDNANPRQRYPVEMEKYWDGYFQNQGDIQSKTTESDSTTTPHVYRHRNRAAPQLKPPGAYSFGREGDSSRQRQEVLDTDEEAALSTSPPTTTGNNGEDDDASLLVANKVEDVDVIINATDVRKDNFKQRTILAS
eukprot:scaffold3359_cov123-Cylindrotheca_fusiformis.AAC.33